MTYNSLDFYIINIYQDKVLSEVLFTSTRHRKDGIVITNKLTALTALTKSV